MAVTADQSNKLHELGLGSTEVFCGGPCPNPEDEDDELRPVHFLYRKTFCENQDSSCPVESALDSDQQLINDPLYIASLTKSDLPGPLCQPLWELPLDTVRSIAAAGPEYYKMLVGYAGWGGMQLDCEVDGGDWLPICCSNSF